jgi:hypothetical protein
LRNRTIEEDEMSRLITAAVVGALASAGIALAAPAQAAASNVGSWTSETITCGNNAVSVFPVIVANASGVRTTSASAVSRRGPRTPRGTTSA